MTKNKKLFLFMTLFMLLLVSGCDSNKVTLGVVDRERIFKESVYHDEIKSLNDQIIELEKQLAGKKVEVEKQLKEKEEAANRAIQQDGEARVRAREEQLHNELMEKHKDFLVQKEQEFITFATTVENEVNGELNALMKKLADGSLSEEQSKNIEKTVQDIKSQGEQKIRTKEAQIREEVNAQLAGDRSAVSATLGQFAQSVREELFAKHKKELDTFAEELLGEGQKQQNQLKEKHDALSKTVDESIKGAIKEVAEAKKLDTVFVDYFANSNAVDITDDVLKKIKENKDKQKS